MNNIHRLKRETLDVAIYVMLVVELSKLILATMK